MKKQGTFEDWKALFQKETGRSSDEAGYHPAPGLSSPVYIDEGGKTAMYPEPEFETRPPVSHQLIIEPGLESFLADQASDLSDYLITTITGIGFTPEEKRRMEEFLAGKEDFSLEFWQDSPSYFDLAEAKARPELLFQWREDLLNSEGKWWFAPADDLLWNTGILRGIQKLTSDSGPGNKDKHDPEAYIRTAFLEHAGDEEQLIPLTNRLLAMAIAGIRHYVWDLRGMTPWQRDHWFLLLNVPEILSREAQIFSYGDPLEGSGFFENWSNRVRDFMED